MHLLKCTTFVFKNTKMYLEFSHLEDIGVK